MPFQKGNKFRTAVGKKGRSGRKTKAEEVRLVLDKKLKEITDEMLLNVSKSLVYGAMVHKPSVQKAKDFGLPIYLKNKEKIDPTKTKQILIQVSSEIADKNNINISITDVPDSSASNNSERPA